MNYDFEITKLKQRVDELEAKVSIWERLFTPGEVLEARRQGMLKAAQIVYDMIDTAPPGDDAGITRNVAFLDAGHKIREVADE